VRKAFGDGGTIPWIDYSSANVNFYYFYCLDEDFGPFFIKFCSYFPYTAKLCINGHEYLTANEAEETPRPGTRLLQVAGAGLTPASGRWCPYRFGLLSCWAILGC
jgi:hypothetical protein